MGHAEGYILPKEMIFEKIQETIDLGGTGVLMQGGLHPDLKIEWYEDLFRSIKQRFRIHLHCLSAPEVTNIADVSGFRLRDTIARLTRFRPRLDSRRRRRDPGRRRAPPHQPAEVQYQEWIDVHRTAHQLGMRTTATMMFGCGETLEQRMNHLEIVRRISGGDRRIHGVHPVDIPAREHLARPLRQGRGDGGRVSADAGDFADLPGQHRKRAVVVGDAGAEDLPAGAALRRQRRRQHHDRGERGLGRRARIIARPKRNCAGSSATPASSRNSAIRSIARIS